MPFFKFTNPKYFSFAFFLLLSLQFFAQDRYIDSLKQLLKTEKNDTSYCNVLMLLSEKAPDDEWPAFNDELLKTCENKLKTIQSTDSKFPKYSILLAYAYNNIAYLCQLSGEYDKGIVFSKKALALQEKVNSKGGMAISIDNLGALYQRKNDLLNALEFYEKGIKINEEINNVRGLIFCINQIGTVFKAQGNVVKALAYYDKSLKIAEKNNLKAEIASSLYNLSLIYSSQGEQNKAMETAMRGLKTQEEVKDKNHAAFTMNFIGSLLIGKNETEKALEYFKKALAIRESIGDKRSIAMSYQSLGTTYNKMKDYDKALEYFSKNIQINESIGDKAGMSRGFEDLGRLYMRKGDLNKALTFFQKALQMAQEVKYPDLLKSAAFNLNDFYKKKGDYKKAYEYLQLFIQMRDSVLNLETKKTALKSQFQMEYAKKEQELTREQEKKEILYQQEKLRKQADLEKQKAINYAFLAGIILLIGLAFLIFWNLKRSKATNKIITEQKELVEEKQKEILDSINYAKRIQYTLLAHDEFLKNNLKDHFIFFQPKDIVSGDFYWATRKNDHFYLAVCDSTGHGVPGAFMSLLNISFLNEAINERNILAPNEIFNYVRERLIENISKEQQKDGFDGVLLCVNFTTNTVTYSAANNKPMIMANGQLTELPCDKMPVGVGEKKNPFQLFTIHAEKNSSVYLYTDGYADQFGGIKGKKYKYKQLNELLLANNSKPFNEQKESIKSSFETWKGKLEQVDDVCLIGLRF